MSIEAMKQMVEALRMPCNYWNKTQFIKAQEAIEVGRKAIAEAEKQEPVAWDENDPAFDAWWNGEYDDSTNPYRKDSPAYWAWAGWKAAQSKTEQIINNYPEKDNPKREWVGLTDEEVRQMCGSVPSMKDAVRETEAKLKEKNTWMN